MEAGKISPIILAIAESEKETTAEIRVALSQRRFDSDPLKRVKKIFYQNGMQNTKNRNAILLYINLKKHKFAIFGDEGIHHIVKQNYWDEIVKELSQDLKYTHYENAIAIAVRKLGSILKTLFPVSLDNPNPDELSNEVLRD
ncbi:MAG: TPM domain-containing protein [Deltaproteobacteria bacterium]|nr:TPM domain-containing protein [Deltaproteobacteria bacterium]